MMSINGMISMRARLCGIGEATCIKLVGRSTHRVSDRNFYSRRGCPWPEPPPPERAGGGVIQNRAADALRHRRVSDIATGHVNRENRDTAAHDVTATGFVWIIRFGRKYCHRFRARDRHRSSHACLRRLHRTGGLGHVFRWRRFFFVELRRHFRNRRRFGNGNIFRWRRRLIFRLQRRFDCCRWDVRQIDQRRLALNCRNAHRGQMDRNCAAESGPELPARRRSI